MYLMYIMLILYCGVIHLHDGLIDRLALVDEVTIIQTKKNRQIMEHENAGQTDIIYSYHNAVGTYGKRIVDMSRFLFNLCRSV